MRRTLVYSSCLIIICVLLSGCKSQDYKMAQTLMNESKWSEAEIILNDLLDYKDSAELILECKYQNALLEVQNEQYTEAKKHFNDIISYKDAKKQVEICDNSIIYANAIELMDGGDFHSALRLFRKITGFKDVDTILSSNKNIQQVLSDIQSKFSVGKTITLGTYPQTASGDDNTPIEWICLDRKGDSALLITKYAIKAAKYNYIYDTVTWEDCSLRRILNEDFLQDHFSIEEQEAIMTKSISVDIASSSSKKDVQDKIFILNNNEVRQYFKTKESRMCALTENVANIKNMSFISSQKVDGKQACAWWLRDAVTEGNSAYIVNEYGAIWGYGYEVDWTICVRPAMWVDLEKY